MTPRMLLAILTRLRAMRQRERWGRARLLAYQADALSQSRAYAYARSPLFSRTLPLIRYELSDSVRVSDLPCPIGRPFGVIDGIQGRAEDVLTLPGVRGEAIRVHPLVFHRVMDRLSTGGWQVVQEKDGLRVLLAGLAEGCDTETMTTALQQALAEQRIATLPVRIERVVAIPKTASGKTPLIRAL